jgi:tRNA threonylcarbamoyladenosine biosynthesis protein TsaE
MHYMSTETKFEFVSGSISDTLRIAEIIGKNLRGGETLELRSDIGGGKTTFTRGLVSGAGSSDQVASPTFTISRVYNAPNNVRINHFDFHRLNDPGLMASALGESVSDPSSVTIVEWADIVDAVLPDDRLIVSISATGDDSRVISFFAQPEHSHLLVGLT